MPADFLRLSRLLDLRANTTGYRASIGQTLPTTAPIWVWQVADDEGMAWGADADAVAVHTLAGVAINTPLANVLEGTVVTPVAIAANSLIISNITNNSDILIAGSKAGNSYMAFMVDASTGDTLVGAPTGQSFDVYIAGAKQIDYAAGALAFQQATTINTTVSTLTLSPATDLILKNGLNLIGDTANANMTVGLTINQGAADDHILTFKSSDVVTGLTASILGQAMETDDYAIFGKNNATLGGLRILAMAEDDVTMTTVLALNSIGGRASTTRTTAGRSLVEVWPVQHNGAGAIANMTTDGNVFGIRVYIGDASVTRFMFDAEGSGHADVEWVAFDQHDDLALVDALQHEWTGRLTPMRYGANPFYYNREYLESAGIVGQDSWHWENRKSGVQLRSMVNFTKLAMLHHGALLQVGDRLQQLETENKRLRTVIAAIGE